MISKKILCGVLSFALLTSVVSVSAASFSDVENDPTVSWAKPYIDEMSERGYIKGYEDGTFKPNNTISKTEALLLLSRMIGVNDDSFADSVDNAVKEYSSVLSSYSTNYAKEISFLLYNGVLEEDELDNYISTSNKNVALKRYEAAILLTKLLGAEQEVLANAFVSSSYADTPEIPDSARAYVEYVKEMGIMQGMGNNEDGMPLFSPNTSVTRSQMAKMLCSLIDVIDLSSQTGVIVATDSFNETITITIDGVDILNDITESTSFKINGKAADFDDMQKGMHVKVTHINGKVSIIENYTVIEDAVIFGLISSTRSSNGTQTITIADANDTSIKEVYTLADDAKIKVNGAIDTFGKLKTNNYVSLTIEDELVTLVEVIDKTTTATGSLVSLDATGSFVVLTVENKDGKIVEYEVSGDGAQVIRNSLDSNLSGLMTGDNLTLRLVYGKITKIVAESYNKTSQGTISFITYSTNGTTIGIESNKEVKEYKINKSASVIIDSANGSVYDLRPGTDVEVKLESNEIIRISAAGSVSKSQLTGVVKSTNATYGLMVVTDGGVDYNVFITGTTKIIDSVNGNNVNLKSVEKGRAVSVTGSNSSGVLEATVILLQ